MKRSTLLAAVVGLAVVGLSRAQEEDGDAEVEEVEVDAADDAQEQAQFEEPPPANPNAQVREIKLESFGTLAAPGRSAAPTCSAIRFLRVV